MPVRLTKSIATARALCATLIACAIPTAVSHAGDAQCAAPHAQRTPFVVAQEGASEDAQPIPAGGPRENPMRPGLWDFTRSGGMAAYRLGRFCITEKEIADPLSSVNGYLEPEEKQTCQSWVIRWQDGSGHYTGQCILASKHVKVQGTIKASSDYYTDEQEQIVGGETTAAPIKDIINGRRIGECSP